MKFYFTLISTLLLLLATPSLSQKHTISGYMTDAVSGEVLIGATIFATKFEKGTTTNNYGFYSLTLPASDSVGLVYSYIGYEPQIKKMFLNGNMKLDVQLATGASSLDEVVVRASEQLDDRNVQRAQPGVIDIPISKIKELPAILGETDVLKIVQLLPGVQSGNEGTTGFFVRGGNADQNLVKLDEAVVYNPNHLFGFFSTFNSRALNNVNLIKGGFPAQHGGRLSSILDITMKEGNNQNYKTEGGIGLISSQLTFEGPIKKNEASFIVSGRRTYLDFLARPFLPKGNESNYHFYDLNGKVNWRLSPKDRIFLSGFRGRDLAIYKETAGIEYNIGFGNSTATARWNHLFSPKLFSNTSIIVNSYDQNIQTKLDQSRAQVLSSISDVNGKMEFQYFPNPNHALRFGGVFIRHRFLSAGETGNLAGTGELIDRSKVPTKIVNEWAGYINDEWKVTKDISLSVGVRVPGFTSTDTSFLKIEPRASAKVSVTDRSSIKAGYAVMNQFLHQIPSSTASIPSDIWIPSTNQTLPQQSEQFSIGYFQNFKENKFESSVELYYKTMDRQVLFKEGNLLIQSLDVDQFLTYGKGWSYGAEFFVRKNTGRLTGWVSYTLSRTEQQFDDLNFGKKFPFRYDRTHNLSVTGTYKLSPKWTLSSAFVFTTGAAFTLPVSRFHSNYAGSIFEGNYFVYESRNNTRMNPYHRLDVSATYKLKHRVLGKSYDAEWVFGVYNVYSRLNPYFVYFQVDPLQDKPVAKQVTLLPAIPSVSYNFKF